MPRYYLGLDSSTQSLTAVVIDLEAKRVASELSVNFDEFKHSYGTDRGVVKRDESAPRAGERVWSYPRMWLEALDRLFERAKTAFPERGVDMAEIGAIAGSGQQHGIVCLNGDATASLENLRSAKSLAQGLEKALARAESPIWMDSSTRIEVDEIERGMGGRGELQRITGNVGFERFSGPQIRRIFKEERDVYDRTAQFCLVSSFMASVLAGRIVPVDAGDGAGTNLMDIEQRAWSPAALEATADGLKDKLEPIQPTDSTTWPISPYFHKYGFRSDCRVALWSGDNPCSLIGLGLVRPGLTAASLGTSDTVFSAMGRLRVCEGGQGCVFGSPAGTYMGLVCFANGSLARERVRDQFGLRWSGFTSLLAGSDAGNRELDEKGRPGPFRFLLPYFNPEITPNVPRRLAVYHQLLPTDSEGCVRGVVESRALAARIHSAWMHDSMDSLRLTGGGANNREILKVFANVFGVTVQSLATTSSAALGAALMALRAHTKQQWPEAVAPFTSPVASIEPDPAAVSIYAEMLEEYRALEQRYSGA